MPFTQQALDAILDFEVHLSLSVSMLRRAVRIGPPLRTAHQSCQ
jgi:hypothetical protein